MNSETSIENIWGFEIVDYSIENSDLPQEHIEPYFALMY